MKYGNRLIMSKIGKKLIPITSGVQVQVRGSIVTVKGPKGELTRTLPGFILVDVRNDSVAVALQTEDGGGDKKKHNESWGLYWALIRNMILGVSAGFREALELQGVGFKAAVKGSNLEMSIGFSHPVIYEIPQGIVITTDKNVVTIQGIDKGLVGQVAAELRAYKKPEPYKGSGIRYVGEVVRKKAGKKAVAAGG